jgi:hypothetical protein
MGHARWREPEILVQRRSALFAVEESFKRRSAARAQYGNADLSLGLAARGHGTPVGPRHLAEEGIVQVLGQDLLVLPVGGIQSVPVPRSSCNPHRTSSRLPQRRFHNLLAQFRCEQWLVRPAYFPLARVFPSRGRLALPWPLRFWRYWTCITVTCISRRKNCPHNP